ncbi:hypothetical protein [Streptomyces syringium]|uniref:hypothetical protein n=1 Tax=Streptomyces syringium TaxID=76729 RepID=UPI003AAEC15F
MIGNLLRGPGRRRAVDEVARLRHELADAKQYIAQLKTDLVLTSRDLETARRQRNGALAALHRHQKAGTGRVLVIRLSDHGHRSPAHIPEAA